MAFGLLALVVIGLAGVIRLAPSDLGRWHGRVAFADGQDAPWDRVQAGVGRAYLRISRAKGEPGLVLARVTELAAQTPRTRVLAGTVGEGRITWITRSAVWGFPDYTTAEMRGDGVYFFARLRFGRADFGVNAARLQGWLDGL